MNEVDEILGSGLEDQPIAIRIANNRGMLMFLAHEISQFRESYAVNAAVGDTAGMGQIKEAVAMNLKKQDFVKATLAELEQQAQ